MLLSFFASAQISVNVDLGKPPVWGPVVTTEEYYFLPDINSYYDIRQSQFIYQNNGVWVRNKALPRMHRGYNLQNGNIVVLSDYRGRSPYANFKNHKIKYFKNKGNNGNNYGNGNGHGNGKNKGNKNGKK